MTRMTEKFNPQRDLLNLDHFPTLTLRAKIFSVVVYLIAHRAVASTIAKNFVTAPSNWPAKIPFKVLEKNLVGAYLFPCKTKQ